MTNVFESFFNPGFIFDSDTRINELLAWMYTTQLLEFNDDGIKYTAKYKRELFDNIKKFVDCNVTGLDRIKKEFEIRNVFEKPIQFLITYKVEEIETLYDGYAIELHSSFKGDAALMNNGGVANAFDLLFAGRNVWVTIDGETKTYTIAKFSQEMFSQGEQKMPGIIFTNHFIFTKEKLELLGGSISLDPPEAPEENVL